MHHTMDSGLMMDDSTLSDSSLAPTTVEPLSSLACHHREKFHQVPESMPGYCLPGTPRSRDWKIGDFMLEETLYDNETSRVYKAKCRESGMAVALKLYVKELLHPVHHHQVRREIRIHSSIRHPNIVELYGSFEDDEHYYLVMEYVNKGDLFDYTRTRKGGVLTEDETITMVVLPMLNALEYLHARGIIHRDIKPENILLSSRPSGRDGARGGITAKLADFGLALNQTEERPVTRAGTLEYMPPEVVKNPGKITPECNKDRDDLAYAEKVDVWSLAVLAFEMLYSFPTFGANEKSDVKAMIEQSIMVSKPRFFPEIREISDDAQDFITLCLRKAASTRPSATALKRHRWIQETMTMGSGRDPDLLRSACRAAAPTQQQDHQAVHQAVHRDPEWVVAPCSSNSDENLFPEIHEQKAHSHKILRPKQPDHPAPPCRLYQSMNAITSVHEGRSPRLDKLTMQAHHQAMRHSLDSPGLTSQASSPTHQSRRSMNLLHSPPKLGRHSMDSPASPARQAPSSKPRQSLEPPSTMTTASSPKPRQSLDAPSMATTSSSPKPRRQSLEPSSTMTIASSPKTRRQSLDSPSTMTIASSPKPRRQSLEPPSTMTTASSPKPRQSNAPNITNEAFPKLPKSSYRALKHSSLHDGFALSYSHTAADAQKDDSKGKSRPGVVGHHDDNAARPSYRQRASYESTRVMTKPTHRRHEQAHHEAMAPPRRMSCEIRDHELGRVFRGKNWKLWQMKT